MGNFIDSLFRDYNIYVSILNFIISIALILLGTITIRKLRKDSPKSRKIICITSIIIGILGIISFVLQVFFFPHNV